MNLLNEVPILDQVLDDHTVELGNDFTAYRNHTYRVVNFCLALSASGDAQLEKIAVAAAFHDLGIWTERTFDYLLPSIRLARASLMSWGKHEWTSEISEMILEHHKVSPYQGGRLVEQFRCADWVDVSRGFLRFGLPRRYVNEVFRAWPDVGFHKRLLLLGIHRFRTHPWNPLPMIRV
jgi:hypothetical protein